MSRIRMMVVFLPKYENMLLWLGYGSKTHFPVLSLKYMKYCNLSCPYLVWLQLLYRGIFLSPSNIALTTTITTITKQKPLLPSLTSFSPAWPSYPWHLNGSRDKNSLHCSPKSFYASKQFLRLERVGVQQPQLLYSISGICFSIFGNVAHNFGYF